MNKSKLVQQNIRARKNVRNLAITLLPGDKCSVVNMNTYKAPALSLHKAKKIMRDFCEVKHEWSVLLCVFGRSPIDGEYWKTLDVAPDGKYYSNQINDSLRHHHDEMLKNFNMDHFLSLGWIAKPNAKLFDNDKVFKMFYEMGAFEYLAPWEVRGKDNKCDDNHSI